MKAKWKKKKGERKHPDKDTLSLTSQLNKMWLISR